MYYLPATEDEVLNLSKVPLPNSVGRIFIAFYYNFVLLLGINNYLC